MSKVKITGMSDLLEELEKRLGKDSIQRITDKGLTEGARVFVKELQAQVATFSDGTGYSTGGTLDEITTSGIVVLDGVRTIRIHWKGPKGRYRIIHLTEWGTVKNPRPRGRGSIARAIKNAETAYRNEIKKAIKEGI